MISEIVSNINAQSMNHRMGEFQYLRKHLKNKSKIASRYLFDYRSTNIEEGYAFHYGGRKELQFNIGFESNHGKDIFRFGVAFSLEQSRSLPDVSILYSHIVRFNEFIRNNPDLYADMRWWVWRPDAHRTFDAYPSEIHETLIRPGNFIFFGAQSPAHIINYDLIILTLDRLIPMYIYVESIIPDCPFYFREQSAFCFQAGNSFKLSRTKSTMVEGIIDVNLRHNDIQAKLFEELVLEYGASNVGTERPNGAAGRIDIVARAGTDFHFFEIKVSGSARGCIRSAVGQLLEYALWPGCQIATKIIVVGEPALDDETKSYLSNLNANFPIPISYRRIEF